MNLEVPIRQLSIVRKDLKVERLDTCINWAQLELLHRVQERMADRKPVRAVVLKARQMGLSTIIEAIMFTMAMMMDRMRGTVISHENDSAQHLLGILQFYWDTYTFKPLWTEKYRGLKHLAWKENDGRINVATAQNVKAGRSKTTQFLHASEVGFYDNAKTLMTGLNQSIPNLPLTFQFLESTANGIGNYFHQQWLAAENGDTEYMAMFFPWWKHPEYILPFAKPVLGLDDEEQTLVRFLRTQELDTGEINGRLAWRRWAINDLTGGNLSDFHQEYPSDPEEAFVATGTNVFPMPKLKLVYQEELGIKGRLQREGERVRFQVDPSGPLTIFRRPSTDIELGVYMIAGDPTRTTVGDYAVIQVLNRRTWEQVAVWRGKVDPNTFAEHIVRLGTYFNRGMVTCEIEGPGYGTIAVILHLEYPLVFKRQLADKTPGTIETRWGWSSTNKTKPEMIGNLLKAVVDRDILIHDKQTFKEMVNYVELGNGEYGNSNEEEYDDCVTSLAMALTCTMYEALGLAAAGTDTPAPTVMHQDIVPRDQAGASSGAPWEQWGDEHANV